MSGHGGARPGGGRKTAFQIKERDKAAKAAVKAADKADKAALSAAEKRKIKDAQKAEENLYKAAAKGEQWAIIRVLDEEKGKPGARLQTQADTSITILQRFPRGPFSCPQCGYKDTGVQPEPKETEIEHEDVSLV